MAALATSNMFEEALRLMILGAWCQRSSRCSKLQAVFYSALLLSRPQHDASSGIVAAQEAPYAGGGGYAAYFDHEQNDIISWVFPGHTPQAGFTVEFWIFQYDLHRKHAIFDYDTYDFSSGDEEGSPYEYLVKLANGGTPLLSFKVNTQDDCVAPACYDLAKYSMWQHVALATNHTADGEVVIYIDGKEVRRKTLGGNYAKPLRPDGVAILGQASSDFNNDLDSSYTGDFIIDHFRWWDHARSPKEVATYYKLYLDPTLHPGMFLMLAFDKVYSVDGSLFLADDTNNVDTVNWGMVVGRKNSMFFTSKGTVYPTAPRLVASRADIYGKELVVYVFPDEEVTFTLRGYDPHGKTLTTSIVSVPSSANGSVSGGMLLSLDSAELEVGDIVLDKNESEHGGPRVQYVAPSISAHSDWSANFSYMVTNSEGMQTEAVVVIKDQSSWVPEVKDYHTEEDGKLFLKLGTVGMNGMPLTVVVTSLPHVGKLYQARWSDTPTYANMEQLFLDNETLITAEQVPVAVEDKVGVLVYIPPADESATDSALTSFMYLWRYESGAETPEAACNIWVSPMNDAPRSTSQTIHVSENATQVPVTLGYEDIDATFAPHPFFKIKGWPILGTLLQEDGSEIEEKLYSSTILQPSAWSGTSLKTAVLFAQTSWRRHGTGEAEKAWDRRGGDGMGR
ncbi:hypothetical protein CYMTET_34299, partial [Cymbomonas tetramitiformis]